MRASAMVATTGLLTVVAVVAVADRTRVVGPADGAAALSGIPDARVAGAAAPGSTRPAPSTGAPAQTDVPYDGRFTFVRIRYETGGRGMRGFGRGGREPLWAHDNPRAERNFAKILDATTSIGPHVEGEAGRILTLDDPELFKYPIAYIVEVGAWEPTDREVQALREYLQKGGFLIVDDFRGPDIYNFQGQLARVLPWARLQEVDRLHPIFDAFFHIDDPSSLAPPTYAQYVPIYLGIFEDNDPSKRLMVMINYNNDIAEYWEYSDRGYHPIDLTNDAYKFGVNYIIYAMTH